MNVEDILKQYAAGHRDFSTVKLTEANLSGINLSQTNLHQAQLTGSRLNNSNLSQTNLRAANLNGANLTLANLEGTDLGHASLVRAELERADLSNAILSGADLSGANLKNANLRNSDLIHTTLNSTDLRGAILINAEMVHANLHSADLSGADLSRADLSQAELRQANLSRANLRGANLSGANLRWADLSGANLDGADLSQAKLSGATLTGANLSHTHLAGTSLVHSDLSRANLIGADWSGADLSGATLTGSKLYGVRRFGIKTEGLICDWVDLSPNGDQSLVQHLGNGYKDFFRYAPPTVSLVVDTALEHETHSSLALIYRQLCQCYDQTLPVPNLQIGQRRTTLTFEASSDSDLMRVAFVAILPFQDAIATHQALSSLLDRLVPQKIDHHFIANFPAIEVMLHRLRTEIEQIKLSESSRHHLCESKFLQAPTRTTLINSNGQTLRLHSHPSFGKPALTAEFDEAAFQKLPVRASHLPQISSLMSFLQGFHLVEG
jgi:uncharacterized protein YjbI with pentapeptide repeats